MDWSDERYVRVYTRDTPDWQCLSFLAQGLFCLILRKVDRAGVLPLGRSGRRAVAISVGHGHQWSLLEPALDELLADGCVRIEGDLLVVPNFLEAQEAEASDKARARAYRERRRDRAKGGGAPDSPSGGASRNVTRRSENATSRDGGVTNRDEGITRRVTTVTPSRAVPPVPPVPSAEAAAAAAAPTRLPTREERLAARWPLASHLAAGAAEAWGHHVSLPKTETDRQAVEQAVGQLGDVGALQEVLDDVAAAIDAGRLEETPSSLGWCVRALQRAAARPPAPPARGPRENPRPGDPDFNDPDAWWDYDAFLRRDAGAGAGGAHA